MIKLVVLNEHTLGYILPEMPSVVHIIETSPLKGSPTSSKLTSCFPLGKLDDVRLASKQDFQEFGVVFDGYEKSKDYEYK